VATPFAYEDGDFSKTVNFLLTCPVENNNWGDSLEGISVSPPSEGIMIPSGLNRLDSSHLFDGLRSGAQAYFGKFVNTVTKFTGPVMMRPALAGVMREEKESAIPPTVTISVERPCYAEMPKDGKFLTVDILQEIEGLTDKRKLFFAAIAVHPESGKIERVQAPKLLTFNSHLPVSIAVWIVGIAGDKQSLTEAVEQLKRLGDVEISEDKLKDMVWIIYFPPSN
jgi:hypothetical protein